MMLRLTIENVPSLASGDPVEVSLAEHGLVIGRAAHADWTLPDPNNHVSSLHCEIDYRDGRYFLADRSTNGTFINGAGERLAKPVQLRDGDLLQIGHYQVRVEEVPDGGTAAPNGPGAGASFGGGIDWGAGADSAAKPVSVTKFGREAARPMFQSANDPLMAAFAAPSAASHPDPFGVGSAPAAPDPFGVAPAARAPDPFGATPAADPFGVGARPALAPDPFGMGMPPPSPDPFGTPPAAPPAAADPFGMPDTAAPPFPPAAPPAGDPWAMLSGAGAVAFAPVSPPPPTATAPVPQQAAPAAAPHVAAAVSAAEPAPAADALYTRLLAASGLDRRDMGARTPEAVVDTIGKLLRQTADGLFKLLEARTRVRHQFGVGAQVTTFQQAGNNPLKWTRSPDQALKQMIGEPGAGFLEGTQAVRGAFEDLQAHEMAMMAAMQEAMQATIKRFAPETIRARISARGWLKSVLPGSREATLWRAYESEFSAFADESEAAYLDLFAKQFKKAYERIVSNTGA
jgi:type VI secretion system FHA domain protein